MGVRSAVLHLRQDGLFNQPAELEAPRRLIVIRRMPLGERVVKMTYGQSCKQALPGRFVF